MSVLTEPGPADATAIQDLFPKQLGLVWCASEPCQGLGADRCSEMLAEGLGSEEANKTECELKYLSVQERRP